MHILISSIVVALVVFLFLTLSHYFGPAMRRRRREGAWLATLGHLVGVGCTVGALATSQPLLAIAGALLGIPALLAGHVGLWIVILGTRPGRGVRPGSLAAGNHALAQGFILFIGLLVVTIGGGLLVWAV